MNLQNIDWNKFRTFYHVAKAESFTRAAQKLRVSQPALSRRIAALEASLGMRLLERSVRGVVPTEEGKALLETVDAMFNVFLHYGERVNNKDEPQGFLKISQPCYLPSLKIFHWTTEFLEACPQMKLSFIGVNGNGSFNAYQADAAIREFDENAQNLEQIYLTTSQVGLYASTHYVRLYGAPHSPQDLDHHRLIALGDTDYLPSCAVNSVLEMGMPRGKQRTPTLCVTSFGEMKQVVQENLGIAALPEEYVVDDASLVRIFPDRAPLSVDLYYVYPSHHKATKRVTAYGAFLAEKMKTD